jgi:hypothetical protein
VLGKLQMSLPNKKKEIKILKDKLYKKLVDGFYVYAKGEIKTAEQAGRYVGRYTGRPAIAESRIIKYDENIYEPPTFSCEACGGIMRPRKYKGVHGITYEF